MTEKMHSTSVYRYEGKTSPFSRFSYSVLAVAAACTLLHVREVVAFLRGVGTTLASKTDEAASVEEAVPGLRVDFAAILRRFYRMSAWETFLLVLAVVTCLLGILCLLSLWYINIRLHLFYTPCMYLEGTEEYRDFVQNVATHIYTVTAPPGEDGSDEKRAVRNELIELKKSRYYIYYSHGYSKYIFDERKLLFLPVEHVDSVNLAALAKWRGLAHKCEGSDKHLFLERSVSICEDRFGDNDYAIPVCDFWAMLLDSFLSPFFMFQLFTTLIWIMDNYWYYSLMSVFSIVAIEVQMVNKRIRDYNRINAMRIPPTNVSVYRDMRWVTLPSNKLYPGDLFILEHEGSNKASVVPADCLILSGDVVVDESILTGESVPQFKSALDIGTIVMKRGVLSSSDSEMRQSTIFAGTTVMLCRGNSSQFTGVKAPRQGCICMVLRTGFESYQGRLVNAIMNSGERITASTPEGWCFLGILLIFAIGSCVFVVQRLPTASIKKLILTTLHIITSVIPPEFPVILSMAVTLSVLQLHKKGIYCTEPFRVPIAGKLDVCAFDKTGTLTEDQMRVVGVASEASVAANPAELAAQEKSAPQPIAVAYVIGGCHSLSRVSGKVVGDPMERAAFEYFGWSLSNDSKSVDSLQPWFYNNKQKLTVSKITVLRRWQFLSELGRMSTIVSVSGDSTHWQRTFTDGRLANANAGALNEVHLSQTLSTVSSLLNGHGSLADNFDGDTMVLSKGAPERIRSLLKWVPSYYEPLYQRLAIGGMRVLALAYKRLHVPSSQIQLLERDEAERGLEFVGFLALESPIKPSANQCMRQLKGMKLIMITGDNVLTACHVANKVEIADRTHTLEVPSAKRNWGEFAILVSSNGSFIWRLRSGEPMVSGSGSGDFVDQMHRIKDTMRLCITGVVLDALLEYEKINNRSVVAEIVLNVTVFARVSPQQKEFVIRTFKRAGKKTAMCGDGTNDMAALKAAHVGISLLKSAVKKEPTKLAAKLSGMINKQVNQRQKEVLEQLKRDLQDEVPQLKLGEASIASPFTYRGSDVLCVPLLVKSGRCALTNVVLLYKVMGINAMITSLGMSVLGMDGVNLNDAQTTLYSMMYTVMLMALSRSKPAQGTSCKRPESSVFSPANMVSLVGQCCLNIGVVLYLWNLGKIYRPDTYVPDLDKPFEPNLVNTLVYYACFVVNLSGFFANYQGYPYMQPLKENRLMYRLLVGSIALILILACDVVPPLRDYLSLVPIPNYAVLAKVLFVLTADVVGSLGIEQFCRRFLAR